MARSQATDFLQSFRFHVKSLNRAGDFPDPLQFGSDAGINGEAGFQSVTLPELSTEAVEYREGTFKYTKKQPGVPTVSDVTMMRGVVKTDTDFYDWLIRGISGGEYRCDFSIKHFAREDLPDAPSHLEYGDIPEASREYKCYNGVPIRVKPAGDLDATSSEISMAEVDVAIEYFEIVVA